MRGTLRPERVKGKNMKKYSKIARIAAFALAVVMLFAFAGCSGKKDNNNKKAAKETEATAAATTAAAAKTEPLPPTRPFLRLQQKLLR